MKIKNTTMAVAIAGTLMGSGCATVPNRQVPDLPTATKSTFASDDPCSNNARNIGAVAGAIFGTVLGKTLGDGKAGTMLGGAAVGALIGGFIGSDIDRRRCELSKVAKAHNLDILMTDISFSAPAQANTGAPIQSEQNPDEKVSPAPSALKNSEAAGMSLTVFDHGKQFAPGSSKPAPDAVKAFGDVAGQYAAKATGNEAQALQTAKERNRKMRILLIGHTDDTGPSQVNADLSEARARAIAKIFEQHGFSANQIYYQGAGEVFPIADNRTEEGRNRNRRVEIVDLSNDAAFEAFLASRQPNVAHYRPAEPQSSSGTANDHGSRKTGRAGTNSAGKASTSPLKATHSSLQERSAAAPAPAVDLVANSGSAVSPPGNPASKTVPAVRPEAPVVAAASGSLDFGGKLFAANGKAIDIGNPVRSGGFSIISNAYAASKPALSTCATDRPRISNRLKSLESGQAAATSAYLPGTASSSWSGKVNGHLVGLTGVAVLRDGGQPAGRPILFVWKDWVDGSKAKPIVKTTADVNAYQGDKALLYRVFPNDGPVRCVDIVIPATAPSTAPASILVYEHAKAMYQADYSPTIAR